MGESTNSFQINIQTLSAQIPARCFVDIEKIVLIFILKNKGNIMGKNILKKTNKVGCIMVPSLKTHYIVTVVKTVWCWWRDKHMGQRNR